MEKYGVVVTFKDGLSKEDAEKLADSIYAFSDVDEVSRVESYNPEQGEPVWYIP